MLLRFLLLMSSTLTLVLGVTFFIAGIYTQTTWDFKAKLAQKIDLSSVPQGEAIKKDILYGFQDSGLILTASWIFIAIGSLIITFSVLGIWATMTGSTFCIVMYLSVKAITVTAYLTGIIIVASSDSIFGKSIMHKLADLQNTKFVSIAELYNNSAGDALLVSALFNIVQQQLKCCGVHEAGDIRKSPSWLASSRALAGQLKLRAGQPGQAPSLNNREIKTNYDYFGEVYYTYRMRAPAWLKSRMPPNENFLTDGIKLPQTLPDGIRIPNMFNITPSILHNSKAIEALFEDSLVLRTPITCCKLNDNVTFTFDPSILVKNLVDHNCPFQAENISSVHNETCFAKMLAHMGLYSTSLVIFGIFLGLIMTCNVALGVQLLIW